MKKTYICPVAATTNVKLTNSLLEISGPGSGSDTGKITTDTGTPITDPTDVLVREYEGVMEGEEW